MRFDIAPMEGVTTRIYRTVHAIHFPGADRYYTPFISATPEFNLKGKDLREVDPRENPGVRPVEAQGCQKKSDMQVSGFTESRYFGKNLQAAVGREPDGRLKEGLPQGGRLPERIPELVPQVLCNTAEAFLPITKTLYRLGYREINLNLGCPAGTVVSKRKGSGLLAFPEDLDRFLEATFRGLEREGFWIVTDPEAAGSLESRRSPESVNRLESVQGSNGRRLLKEGEDRRTKMPVRISIKTRIGKEDPSEAARLIEIYNRYPIAELTVHPRVQREMYNGIPHEDVFAQFVRDCRIPLVYNGNIFSAEDYLRIRRKFPTVQAVMVGRGLIADPALVREM